MRSRVLPWLVLAVLLLAGCVQSTSTSDGTPTPTAQIGVDRGGATAGVPLGAPIEVIPAWIQENAILVWKPAVLRSGVYQFAIENRGAKDHDFTVVRWRGNPYAIPNRTGRVLLQTVEIVARSPVLAPGQTALLDVDMTAGGDFVIFSAEGADYGDGLVATFTVGSGSSQPEPQPTPDPDDESIVGVYLVDGAVFVSRPNVDPGEVTLQVQNLGPSSHDLLVVQWRGDPHALPVDDRTGEIMLDALTVLADMPAIEAGETAVVGFEAADELGYALVSSLPDDYRAGMGASLSVR